MRQLQLYYRCIVYIYLSTFHLHLALRERKEGRTKGTNNQIKLTRGSGTLVMNIITIYHLLFIIT